LTLKEKYGISTGRMNLLTVIMLLLSFSSFAQENFPLGSRPAALANAYVMESDLWSVFHNQAGLGSYNHFAIGFHNENKFLLKESSLHALALTLPVKPGTIGFSYSYFGFEKYNESKIGLGFGKTFGEKFSAGVQLNFHRIFQPTEYGNRNSLSIEGGIQYKPVNSVTLGLHIFNPTGTKISAYERDTIPTILRAGLSYKPYEKLWLGLETEKTLDSELKVKAGVEYRLLESLFLRTGIVTNPIRSSFGLGYQISKISADIAFTRDETLGFLPHFTFRFQFR